MDPGGHGGPVHVGVVHGHVARRRGRVEVDELRGGQGARRSAVHDFVAADDEEPGEVGVVGKVDLLAVPAAVHAAGAVGVDGEPVAHEDADLEVGVEGPPDAVLVDGALLEAGVDVGDALDDGVEGALEEALLEALLAGLREAVDLA